MLTFPKATTKKNISYCSRFMVYLTNCFKRFEEFFKDEVNNNKNIYDKKDKKINETYIFIDTMSKV